VELDLGKANILILNPDLTFTEKRQKTQETEIKFKNDYAPTFSPGLSVFSETGIPKWKFWRTHRKLILILDGAAKAFEMKTPKKLEPNYWTTEERRKFVAKVVAKSKAEQKPMSNWQFVILALMVGLGLLIQFLVARRVGF
jgi:hypothetical protein